MDFATAATPPARAEYSPILPFQWVGFPGGRGDRDIWYEKQKQENRNDSKVAKGMRDVEGLAETEIDFGKEFFSYL